MAFLPVPSSGCCCFFVCQCVWAFYYMLTRLQVASHFILFRLLFRFTLSRFMFGV